MRSPINLLLYLLSAGLIGLAGKWFYEASPKLGAKAPDVFTAQGAKEADELLQRGRGASAAGASWVYSPIEWWRRFENVNLIGKLPPKPVEAPKGPVEPVIEVKRDVPLDQIIELISLVYDGRAAGKGGDTQVMVRYRPEANVRPPEEELRRLAAAGPRGGPGDVAATQPVRPNGRPGPRPATPLPVGPSTGPELVHYVRAGETLWEPYQDIRLVRVSADAEEAFFVRIKPDADPASEPKEESLLKNSMQLSQEVLRALLVARRSGGVSTGRATESQPAGSQWVQVEETTRLGDVFHIGTRDQDMFGEDPDRFLERINVDTYVSRFNPSVRGVQVRNVESSLGQRFGIQSGDVLLAINGESVRTKSEAYNVGRRQYNRGVRTFVARFLTATGQEIERTYQAPERR